MQLYKGRVISDLTESEYINETVKCALVTVKAHLVTVVNLGVNMVNTAKVIW